MRLKTMILAGIAGLTIAASAYGGGHSPVSQRQAAMKAIGGQMRTLGGMAQGKIAYDDFAVISALEIMRTAAASAQPLFATEIDSAEETRAMPAIWAADSDFDARIGQLIASLDVAIAAEPADMDSYRPLFGAVAGTCKGCHEKYRAPEE